MNKNRFLPFLLVFLAITVLFSCKSEEAQYPKIVNIKFDIVPSSSPEAYITTTINNEENIDFISVYPYSKAITQVSAEVGTYVKLTLQDESLCVNGQNCDYTAEMSISVDEEVVKSESFTVTDATQVIFIDYTFK